MHAGTVIKLGFREGMSREDTLDLAINALFTAADDDSATGGPDLTRRIFPIVQVITAEGGHRLLDSDVAAIADAVIAGRMNRPDGPAAPLT